MKMEPVEISAFHRLRKINVNEHTEKKNGLTYLSWAWAVDYLLHQDPSANWSFNDPVYFGETVMVSCSVTAFGKTMTSHLPVMDHRNQAIKNPDAFHINKNMMRCLAKAIALHGLGLSIYAGEDLPEEDNHKSEEDTKKADEIKEGMNILQQFREAALNGTAELKAFKTMCKGVIAKKVWDKHQEKLIEAAKQADAAMAGAV